MDLLEPAGFQADPGFGSVQDVEENLPVCRWWVRIRIVMLESLGSHLEPTWPKKSVNCLKAPSLIAVWNLAKCGQVACVLRLPAREISKDPSVDLNAEPLLLRDPTMD
jgi:hypothetical protein